MKNSEAVERMAKRMLGLVSCDSAPEDGAVLKPENFKRLIDIENRLYVLNMIFPWSREEREEYLKLSAKRERIRRIKSGGERGVP